jgi:two-component system, OmpR family, sensor kinase
VRTIVALCALAAAALAAGLATLLTRRALRPLTRLSTGARAIERSGDASERLPLPPTHDEVGQLADTLNAMLASLERAREAEHRFVGDASHELRTPLTALRGNAAYVARHGADPAVLADIEADAARLSALLESLLALAREDAAAPAKGEPVDLAELARGLDADAEVTADEPVWVLGERPALERALENLVANAHRHGRGRVTVSVGAHDGWARVTVADEGLGIPPEQAARAFERFWRAPDARGEGSGLGLAIVRAIAERHGGHVSVEGPRFTLAIKELQRPC